MRNNKPLVSVVIPAYKCKATIKQCVDSVLLQTFQDFEIIVIDDCSPDDTFEFISSLYSNNRKIRLIKNKKNSGVSYTRNHGVEVANGKYIAFLDSDDYWLRDKLEKQLDLLFNNSEAKFVFTGSSFISWEGQNLNRILKVPSVVKYKRLLKQNIISCSSVLIEKQLIQQYKMENDKIHEDFLIWLKILRDGNIAYGINQPLLVYRVSSNSKSGNKMKAPKMTYEVYKTLGIKFIPRCWYFTCYTLKSLKKYIPLFFAKLKNKKQNNI